jgi:L1 cell adhesion molecule like protein
VVPLSLGIELASGAMDTVIKRNTPIPFEAKKVFVTAHDDQTRAHFKVYEGERPMTKDNYFLGDFTVKDIEKALKG